MEKEEPRVGRRMRLLAIGTVARSWIGPELVLGRAQLIVRLSLDGERAATAIVGRMTPIGTNGCPIDSSSWTFLPSIPLLRLEILRVFDRLPPRARNVSPLRILRRPSR